MSKILEVSNLSINFSTRDGLFNAVDNISFDIEKIKPWPWLVNQVLVNR